MDWQASWRCSSAVFVVPFELFEIACAKKVYSFSLVDSSELNIKTAVQVQEEQDTTDKIMNRLFEDNKFRGSSGGSAATTTTTTTTTANTLAPRVGQGANVSERLIADNYRLFV